MGTNKYKRHLLCFLEDQAYKDLFNGAKRKLGDRICKFRPIGKGKDTCGGCEKLFKEFEKSAKVRLSNKDVNILLLIDFDNKFKTRIDRLREICEREDIDPNRIFILGIDNKEAEDLKKYCKNEMNINNMNEIGGKIVENCKSNNDDLWKNEHLKCNIPELKRMKEQGIIEWLLMDDKN